MNDLRYSENILPFIHPVEEKVFFFTPSHILGSFKFNISKLPPEAKNLFTKQTNNDPFLYTNFRGHETGKKGVKIKLSEYLPFARIYYKWAIHKYLRKLADYSRTRFLDDNEYWFLHETKEKYISYKKFTIRVQFDEKTSQPELLISFNGIARVWKQSLQQLTSHSIDTHKYGNIVFRKKIYLYDKRPDHLAYHFDNVYPVLNPELVNALNFPHEAPDKSDFKYTKYYNSIQDMFNTYLNTDEFRAIIPHSGQWKKLNISEVLSTSQGSNLLLFGNNKKEIDPYLGIKNNGPYEPSPHKHIKFFLIVHKDEIETANLLGTYFLGKRGYIAFSKFLRLTFTYEKDKHIIFENADNPIEEIRSQLASKELNPDSCYLAIFISPYDKNESDIDKKDYYAIVKEELLNRKITSQFIKKDNILKTEFKHFLSHLGVAMLAKVDGIPWRLDRPVDDELIIGIGAFKEKKFNTRFLGSAFCFANDGTFKGFDCFPQSELFLLAGSIKEAIDKFHDQNKQVKRLIIHFYKTMSDDELAPITHKLAELSYNIPVVIITVNKNQSKDIVFFDNEFAEKIPLSGSYISIGHDKFLLCCNSRFDGIEMKKNDGRPLPIKIQIKSKDESIINDPAEIKKLIDQVYQFSRLNWSSVRQSSMPVTLKYPEIIAKIFPHFTGDVIPDFGKQNMWFL